MSPVHLFWGSFDLAVTRFSGRSALLHPGGIPSLPDAVTREAYSHEVSSAGFWAGGSGIPYPAFYSYAYPAPPGFAEARLEPAAAYFEKALGEFLLPYDAVRLAKEPETSLLSFLESAYAAAATLRPLGSKRSRVQHRAAGATARALASPRASMAVPRSCRPRLTSAKKRTRLSRPTPRETAPNSQDRTRNRARDPACDPTLPCKSPGL